MSNVQTANTELVAFVKAKAEHTKGFIIINSGLVRIGISQAKTMAEKLHARYRILALSTMWHAAKHGDPALLNEFYASLPVSLQTAFKRWVSGVVTHLYPEGTKSSALWIGMANEKFLVKKGHTEAREKFTDWIESVSLETEVGKFWTIDQDKVSKPFDDKALVKRLYALQTAIDKDNAEVSQVAREALAAALAAFKTRAPDVVASAIH
jgi:hypothetical protein